MFDEPRKHSPRSSRPAIKKGWKSSEITQSLQSPLVGLFICLQSIPTTNSRLEGPHHKRIKVGFMLLIYVASCRVCVRWNLEQLFQISAGRNIADGEVTFSSIDEGDLDLCWQMASRRRPQGPSSAPFHPADVRGRLEKVINLCYGYPFFYCQCPCSG